MNKKDINSVIGKKHSTVKKLFLNDTEMSKYLLEWRLRPCEICGEYNRIEDLYNRSCITCQLEEE